MSYWPFWVSGVALACVPIANWFLTRRAFGVSGRYTALVDALRFGAEEPAPAMDQAALLAALRAETLAALGPDAVLDDEPAQEAAADAASPPLPQPSTRAHALFLLGLVLGGALSALLTGELRLTAGLRGAAFAQVLEALHVPAPLLLFVGGALVGFGTRMAGGCTSGHGLCGMSQFQPGSLLATAAFFGAGVGLSFALGALR